MLQPSGRRRPRIDCFYVYPTSSTQSTLNAALEPDSGVLNAVRAQASRFSGVCRLFVPLYRQITLTQVFGYPLSLQPHLLRIAYDSVLAAWKEYLSHYNHGRGVVLIGHSQGASMLKRLISTRIDRRASERRRLVSAVLVGGNVVVRTGQDSGGDFINVPACRSAHQTGCVIAYSSFETPPPSTALFGRPGDQPRAQFAGRSGSGYSVLCTNPAALRGGSGLLKPSFTVNSASGLLGGLGTVSGIQTPWLGYPRLYQASCRHRGGATWLQVTDIGASGDNRVRVTQALGPDYGLHLDDINLAIGNLIAILREQALSFQRTN